MYRIPYYQPFQVPFPDKASFLFHALIQLQVQLFLQAREGILMLAISDCLQLLQSAMNIPSKFGLRIKYIK